MILTLHTETVIGSYNHISMGGYVNGDVGVMLSRMEGDVK